MVRNLTVKQIDAAGYLPTKQGEIVSLKHGKYRVLKQATNNCGYKVVNLRIEGKSQLHPVHRVIAYYLLDRVSGKEYINHINGNKADNRLCNLEWCTHKENMQHAISTGLVTQGINGKYA